MKPGRGSFALSFLLALSGCATSATPVYFSEEDAFQSRVYQMDFHKAFGIAEKSLHRLQWNILTLNQEGNYIVVKPPHNLWTSSLGNVAQGGDRLEMYFIPLDEGRTKVRAVCYTNELYDHGRRKTRLEQFFSSLEQVASEEGIDVGHGKQLKY